MADIRYVRRNTEGGWDVLRDGDRRTSIQADTQEQAIRRARDIVRQAGGGEVRVMNDSGKIVDARTVARPMRRRAAA
jgi:hypothetical protein